jgi:hypothetical protein
MHRRSALLATVTLFLSLQAAAGVEDFPQPLARGTHRRRRKPARRALELRAGGQVLHGGWPLPPSVIEWLMFDDASSLRAALK